MASPPPRLRSQLIVLSAVLGAVVLFVGGALAWSRLAGGDGPNDEVNLDKPGEYVEPGAPTNPPLPSDELPDVDLVAADGSTVRLDGDGRPMVVNLWYSTCPPCARELADFADVHDELGDEVRFVGVNPLDTAGKMKQFAADRGVTYELLRDPGFDFTDALRIVAFPVTLFVDGGGTIVDHTGPIDDAELRARLDELFGIRG